MEVSGFMDGSRETKWLDRLHVKGYPVDVAARVITRGFRWFEEAYDCPRCNGEGEHRPRTIEELLGEDNRRVCDCCNGKGRITAKQHGF